MKLRNKKTGEIKECVVIPIDNNGYPNEYEEFEKGGSLAELNEEWEDYEEVKYIWYIDWKGNIHPMNVNNNWESEKEIGNYFETKEEAEKAVEKLKAWKRLKDRGFRFIEWTEQSPDEITGEIIRCDFGNAGLDDLDLLFGGEE